MAIQDLSPDLQFLISQRIPPELVLKTIQHLPFEDGKRVASLKTIPRLNALLKTYEHSITRWYMQKELRHALSDFPDREKVDLAWLARCVERYDVVDYIMEELTWPDNTAAVAPHNVALVNTGLLLLYRLDSMPTHASKLALLTTFALAPLTALYLTLHHATLTARWHGTGWIHQHTAYGSRFMDANQISLRNELEFCFAEATLSIGPAFLYDMLVNPTDPSGETTLLNFYHEHGTHDWEWPCWGTGRGEFEPPRTEGPQREGGMKGRSLYTCLVERVAGLRGEELRDVKGRVEGDLRRTDHGLAYLSLGGKERLVGGRDLDGV